MTRRLEPLFSGLPESVERLAVRAEAAATLADKVRAALPEALRPHIVSAVRREQELVVIVDSAAWGPRVRYAGRALRESLVVAGEAPFDRVRVRVGVPIQPIAAPQ
jgi:hypothetical protein